MVAVSLTVVESGAHIEPVRSPHKLAAGAARTGSPSRTEPRRPQRGVPRPSPAFIERHVNRCDSCSQRNC